MLWVLAWISPGIIVCIALVWKWYKGENITHGDLKLVGIMSSMGIFLSFMEKNLSFFEDPRILIPGRKQKNTPEVE